MSNNSLLLPLHFVNKMMIVKNSRHDKIHSQSVIIVY